MPPWNNLPDAARAAVTFAASLAIVANHYVLEMVSRVSM
jgi:hypothetical protein